MSFFQKHSWFFPILTISVHVFGLLFLWWHILGVVQPKHGQTLTSLSASYFYIGMLGGLGLVTSLAGIFTLIRYEKPAKAFLLMLFSCLPSLFVSMGYLYALLLFEGTI